MSGGAWDYLGRRFEEWGEGLDRIRPMLEVVVAIEHELDWGASGDTCLPCARRRVIAALVAFFDDRGSTAERAVAVARDDLQNQCPECVKRDWSKERGKAAGW